MAFNAESFKNLQADGYGKPSKKERKIAKLNRVDIAINNNCDDIEKATFLVEKRAMLKAEIENME